MGAEEIVVNNDEQDQIWKTVLADIELNTSKANFVTWFKNTSLIEKKEGVATVSVPNAFTKEWLENKYHKTILKLLRNISPEIKEVRYLIGPNIIVPQIPRQKKITTPQVVSDNQLDFKEFEVDKETNLNPRYTFDSFIVGSFNELAHAAALSVVKNPARAYNPLFIYSGVGLGKTHLVQAMGNEIVKTGGVKVKYITSEKFTSEVVNAITNNEMDDFKNKYRQVDVLILDDVQFLSGKERTQEEFFHTFNSLYENNKQIILTSDRLPKAIPTLTERLRSRFEGGMIADISFPDKETRMAILRNKA
jgi:chromosomal replication initiator protein